MSTGKIFAIVLAAVAIWLLIVASVFGPPFLAGFRYGTSTPLGRITCTDWSRASGNQEQNIVRALNHKYGGWSIFVVNAYATDPPTDSTIVADTVSYISNACNSPSLGQEEPLSDLWTTIPANPYGS